METATPLNLLFMGLLSLIIWRSYLGRTYARSQQYQTFWPRFLAGWPDGVMITVFSFVASLLVMLPVGFIDNADDHIGLLSTLTILAVCIQIVIPFAYTALMHARYGQTVGKMLTGVRVVDAVTGGPISTKQAWLREGLPLVLWGLALVYLATNWAVESSDLQANTGKMLSGLMVLLSLGRIWLVLEILTMFTNARRRALHDYIAGTVVVRVHIRPDTADA